MITLTIRILFFLSLLSITGLSCQKDDSQDESAMAPAVTTTAISSITTTAALSGGNVTSDGGDPVIARGVCWSNSPNPTISGSHTTDGTGTGTFNSTITGLTQGTTYYVRAYAANSKKMDYGNELSFTTPAPEVYVAGYESNGTTNIAKYWKNGTPIDLTNGSFNAFGYSVFVSGSDVYVAGSENNASGSLPKVWKNGTATTLSTQAGSNAYSVFVSGADVYVAGEEDLPSNLVPRLWKNAVSVPLTGVTTAGFATSVYVSGADVFVGGSNYTASFVPNAVTWKNEIITTLTTVYA